MGGIAFSASAGLLSGILLFMGIFSKLFGGSSRDTGPTSVPDAPKGNDYKQAVYAHFSEFVQSRIGVEAYLEPANANEPSSVLLIATTGEWTRRRVPNPPAGYKIAEDLGIPIYNVDFTGYPQRMRDWNSAQRAARKQRSTGQNQ